MEILKKIGKILAVFLAVGEILGQILGFLLIPALIVACGVLNGYPAEYYLWTLGIYLTLYALFRLGLHLLENWLDRKAKRDPARKK